MATYRERPAACDHTPTAPAQGGGAVIPAPPALAMDDWARFERLLRFGAAAGVCRVPTPPPARADLDVVIRCLDADGGRVVARVVAEVEAGRAAPLTAAGPAAPLVALALAAKRGDFVTRRAALAALPRVCRDANALVAFAAAVERFGGWGRGTRAAVAGWLNQQPAAALARQALGARGQAGWRLGDLVRLAHPRPASAAHDALYRWLVHGEVRAPLPEGLALLEVHERLRRADDAAVVARLVDEHELPRAAVPERWLGEARVWEALLPRLPLDALIGELGGMTRAGLLTSGSAAARAVIERLRDRRRLDEARLPPLAWLAALGAYLVADGAPGRRLWSGMVSIANALVDAFHATLARVAPSGARLLVALDVAEAMDRGAVAGLGGLTPRVASTALALMAAATEPRLTLAAFTAGSDGAPGLTALTLAPRLDLAVSQVTRLDAGVVDCALPMRWALAHGLGIDAFVVHAARPASAAGAAAALRQYRERTGLGARLVVLGLGGEAFTIADADDAGMLDVAGCDAATPARLDAFVRPTPA